MVKSPQQVGIGPILAVTVTTDDLAASVDAYRTGLGYVELGRGRVCAAEARAWRAHGMAGRAWALLACRPGQAGAVRLVEASRPDGHQPLQHLGWAALEIAVTDVDVLASKVERAGFRVLRYPAPLTSSAALRAMQVTGPSGEVLYLTQRLSPLPGFDLPEPVALADRIFIAVLASADLDQSRAVYESRFGAQRKSDRHVAIRVLNDSFGLPDDTPHRLSTVQLDGQSLIEIDQYPAAAAIQPRAAGELPWGVGLVTVASSMSATLLASVQVGSDRTVTADEAGTWPGIARVCTEGAAGELLELLPAGS